MKTLTMRLTLLLASALLIMPAAGQTEKQMTDAELLELYEGLRVADVSDGMDMVGLRDIGLLDQSIVALWKDIDDLTHIFRGIAVTARYVPTNRVVKNPMDPDEFRAWEGSWYGEISPEPWVEALGKGSVVVLDVQGDGDVGSIGSFNSMLYIEKGAVGIVSNGGIRDTDEIIKQKIPVYLDMDNRGRGIRPGRNELESFNKPVTIAGVLIRPGDVIVADGDGVICVPKEHAEKVAVLAHAILKKDKESRKRMYEVLGLEPDETIE
jgi:4-hydroxy-4-methyl-2-oxoglutarate aldolase